MVADLDVVVIGGGLQGLLALEALQALGYACALVSDGDLGDGQTLHSHGFLNTGFGMVGDELPRAARDVVEPYLREHGVGPSGEWRAVLPPGVPAPFPAAPLPSGFDPSLGAAAVALPDHNVPKRGLVMAVMGKHADLVLRGRASIRPRDGGAHPVTVHRPDGSEIVMRARVIVVAAGCGSKRLVGSLVGATPQTEQIKHRRVHMICVRAPRGALPAMSVVAMPLGLMVAAHENGEHVTWYVTPMEFGGPAFDDVPNDAVCNEDPATRARGFAALQQLFPGLAEVGGVMLGSYAGYRQDVGDQPAQRLCEPLTGAEHVIVALPSGLVAPWLNTMRIVDIVADLLEPSGDHTSIPSAGVHVAAGCAVEDRPGFAWRSFGEFARAVS